MSPRRLAFALGALSTFGPLSIDMYLPGLPALAHDLRLSESAAQLTITGCLLGLGIGQLVVGAMSDALGRRSLLLLAALLFAVTSLACAFAPNGALLISLRLLQGIAGGGGIVVARSIVRDLYSGAEAARYYSVLMLVSALAPILAPLAGGALLKITTWHGVFVVLALLGVLLLVTALAWVPETLPIERRRPAGLGNIWRAGQNLFADPSFVGYTIAVSLTFGGFAAYLAGSSFVLEGIYHVSPQVFAGLFALNAVGLWLASQLNRRLLRSFEPGRLVVFGLCAFAIGGAMVLIAVLIPQIGIAGVMAGLFTAVSSLGVVSPNAIALALTNHPEAAGMGSALIGIIQFGLGAAVAPLVGLAGPTTAVPMALVMSSLALSSLALILYWPTQIRTTVKP